MFDLFQDENVAQGLPPKGKFQAGISNFDPPGGVKIEDDIVLPWVSDSEATWMYYDVKLACFLDSGMVTHRHLPQYDPAPATLASCFVGDKNLEKIISGGVNLISGDNFSDVVQRMAHSQYWFRLWGQAMRAGYEVPIPGLKTVGGVKAIQHDDPNVQMGYNRIVGNYSGIPVYHAVWSLWYTVADPPSKQQLPPENLGVHIAADSALPEGMQSPWSEPDEESQSTNPLGTVRPRATP